MIVLSQKSVIPFKNTFPTDTKLYRAMTTKPSDLAKYREEEKMKNGITPVINDKKEPETPKLSRFEENMKAANIQYLDLDDMDDEFF